MKISLLSLQRALCLPQIVILSLFKFLFQVLVDLMMKRVLKNN